MSESPITTSRAASTDDAGTRPYDVYRVEQTNPLTLVLVTVQTADHPDTAITDVAEQQDEEGVEYVALANSKQKRRKPRLKIRRSWEFD